MKTSPWFQEDGQWGHTPIQEDIIHFLFLLTQLSGFLFNFGNFKNEVR